MSTIHIKIEAFGAIEKLLPSNLSVSCQSYVKVEEVLNRIVALHPQSAKTMEKCACAIGDHMISRHSSLSQSCTLVLLSPVAGG